MSCPDKNKCRLCGSEGHLARSCPTPWGVREAAAPAPLLEQAAAPDATVAAGLGVEIAVSSATEALDAGGPSSAVSSDSTALSSGTSSVGEVQIASGTGQTVPVPVIECSSREALTSCVQNVSGTGQTVSDTIGEFSSQDTLEPSSQDSLNISDFSDESQSVLRNVYGSVIDQSNVDAGVEVLEEGQAPSSSGDSQFECMDSSVSLKRAREAEFATPAIPVRLSRHRSRSRESRKKSRGGSRSDSLSVSPSPGRHSRLPVVTPVFPRNVPASPRKS